MSAGAHIGAKDKNGKTPLHLAIENQRVHIIKIFLEAKTDLEATDGKGQTALHLAVQSNNEEIVQLLLEAGAQLNVVDDSGRTPLSFAFKYNLTELLIAKMADPNISSNDGMAPLQRVWNKLKLGASNSNEVRDELYRIVKLLLQAKANPQDAYHYSELFLYAVKIGDIDIVKLLLPKANLESKYGENLAALHLAVKNGYTAIAQLLVDAGANIEARDDKDETPLHCAAKTGHTEAVRLLLGKDANTETVNKSGKTPLNLASNSEVVKLLRSAKSPVTPVTNQENILPIMDRISFLSSFTIDYKELIFGATLGKGGFGIVFLGDYRHNKVAIKQLHVTHPSPSALKEFQTEMAIMARLRCPQIVQLYGIYMDPSYGIVMEFLARGSLYKVLHSDEPLSWEIRHQIAFDIACGLAFLHKENILHRDLKSLNVLLSDQMQAKLTDFGLAEIKNETSSAISGKQIAGTLQWMAPELFGRYATYTQKADMYSLGMTLWELIARKTPFANAYNPGLIPGWVLAGDREEIPNECPPKIAELIQFCWNKEPASRPTANEAVLQLKAEEQSSQLDYRSNLNSAI